jgi:hemolysin III
MPQLTTRGSTRDLIYRGLVAIQSRVGQRRPRPAGFFCEYPPLQSAAEERANGLTHGIAAIASLVGAVWLILTVCRRGDALLTTGCIAYALSLISVFAMSTLSHVVELPRLRQLFRTLDQAAIYLLIAGTCTPYFIRYLLPFGWGWLLVLIWAFAFAGVWRKVRGDRVNSVSVLFCVALGWLPTIAARSLWEQMPAGCLALVISSGALYMAGVVFLCYDDRRPFFHAIWHLFVIAASVLSFAGIALYAA